MPFTKTPPFAKGGTPYADSERDFTPYPGTWRGRVAAKNKRVLICRKLATMPCPLRYVTEGGL